MATADWKIRRREELCAACGRAFTEGEAFFSLLLLSPEELRREDRCPACFEVPPAGTAVFWRTRRRPERRSRLSVDFDAPRSACASSATSWHSCCCARSA
jgi:hypothetical protein